MASAEGAHLLPPSPKLTPRPTIYRPVMRGVPSAKRTGVHEACTPPTVLYAARRAGERAGRLGLGLPAAGWAARNGGGTKVAPKVAEAEGPL